MRAYAQDSAVSIDRSRAEIERILTRAGATAFMYARREGHAAIIFQLTGRTMRFTVLEASAADPIVCSTPSGRRRRPAAIQVETERETRRRWRAFVLILKAKLEAIHSGVVSMEEEFLPYMQLQDGRTVAEWSESGLKPALELGRMPAGLLGPGAG